MSFEEVIELFACQYKLRKRLLFDNLKQGDESIEKWYVKVKQLGAPCKFNISLTERVKDKFVTKIGQFLIVYLKKQTPSL